MSKPNLKKSNRVAVFAVGLCLAAPVISHSAKAALIAYEGFNYVSGSQINAQSGGTGWGLNWSSTGSATADRGTNIASGLSYGSLATSGGCVEFGPAAATLVYTRQFGATLGASASSGVVWVSMLYLNHSTGANTEVRINFSSGLVADATGTNTATSGATQVVGVGRPTTGALAADEIALFLTTTAVTTGVPTPRDSNAAFLLMKFSMDGGPGNDTLSLWVNPDLSLGESGLGAAQATWTTSNLDSINGLRFQTPGTTGIFDIDEIRIGTTFADAAPVSASLPSIQTSHSGNNITLTWPESGTDGFALEGTVNLTPPVEWNPVNATLTTNAGTISATLPATNSHSYFRLKK